MKFLCVNIVSEKVVRHLLA